ncbi:ImmA/IrrE family metallo-endopeptidase [Gardnerella swidsinskii]|uniref:ImmA/IrrE family metallo-endopeptidase n=1 Tax=Gardnerella swidsinskii TaxID=2792979 RepID=UPI0036F46AD1
MYRSGSKYDELDKLIYSIYDDYGINKFPIDEKELCRKMKISLVPYSAFSNEAKKLLRKNSKHAFFVKESKENPPMIYYNDAFGSEGAIRFSVFHEIGHYICEDKNDSKDDLADYFARHFMCPTAYLMLKGIESPNEIVAFCGVSFEAARNASANIANRKKKLGFKLFSYEEESIKNIDPITLWFYKLKEKGGTVMNVPIN